MGISAAPAYATTLAVTSLTCETGVRALYCDGWVSGGTGVYTYTWSPASSLRHDYATHSEVTYSCVVGTYVNMTFTVRDSSGATASKSKSAYCSGANP
jgi:hypothetical protein